jgi:hemerythrin-like metal-binding protein
MNHIELKKDHQTDIGGSHLECHNFFIEINAILFPESGEDTAKDLKRSMALIMEYVDNRFSEEEREMEYFGYQNLNGHRMAHRILRMKISQLQQRADETENSRGLTDEFLDLLQVLFTDHARKWDTASSLFTREYTRLEFESLGLSSADFDGTVLIDFEQDTFLPS